MDSIEMAQVVLKVVSIGVVLFIPLNLYIMCRETKSSTRELFYFGHSLAASIVAIIVVLLVIFNR
jgi:hypothetical protein